MPPSRVRDSAKTKTARSGPYAVPQENPAPSKDLQPSPASDEDKENRDTSKTTKAKAPRTKKAKEPDRSGLPENYLDIPLDEVKGEVPVYEDCAAIRRKLNKLIESKTKIPGSNKTFTKAAVAAELHKIAENHHPIKGYQGRMEQVGPSANAVTRFLKKSGTMAGGDTTPYYYGNMLLEKLRIWNGEKKTKGRLNAEAEFPNGRKRCDPDHMWITQGPGLPPLGYSDLTHLGR